MSRKKRKNSKKLIPSISELARLFEKSDNSVPTWCGGTRDEWAELYNSVNNSDDFIVDEVGLFSETNSSCPF